MTHARHQFLEEARCDIFLDDEAGARATDLTLIEPDCIDHALHGRVGAAVVMVAASLYHLAYLASARGRQFLRDMVPILKDAVQVVENLGYLAGLRSTPPASSRFGYIEKAEYWALIWGTVVMTLTGVVLWFENQSLRWLPKWTIDLATLVHYYEAWLAFLAILVWHIYQNVLNPHVYPMNWTWVTGLISDEQLRHEHPGEWQRLAEAEETASGGAPAEASPRTARGTAPEKT